MDFPASIAGLPGVTVVQLGRPLPASACAHGCPTGRNGSILGCRQHPELCEHGVVYRSCRLGHVVGPSSANRGVAAKEIA